MPVTTVRLALALCGVFAADALLRMHPELHGPFRPLVVWTAAVSDRLIRGCGMEVARVGALLSHPGGFSVAIDYVCSGVIPAAIVLLTVVIVPCPLPAKVLGFAAGVALTLLLNFCRIVHLYHTGVVHPEAFVLMHKVVWNIAAVAITLAYISVWLHLALSAARSLTSHEA